MLALLCVIKIHKGLRVLMKLSLRVRTCPRKNSHFHVVSEVLVLGGAPKCTLQLLLCKSLLSVKSGPINTCFFTNEENKELLASWHTAAILSYQGPFSKPTLLSLCSSPGNVKDLSWWIVARFCSLSIYWEGEAHGRTWQGREAKENTSHLLPTTASPSFSLLHQRGTNPALG